MAPDSPPNTETIHYHITQRCSLACRHCSVDGGPNHNNPPLDLHTIHRVISQGRDSGLKSLELTGGDPLILDKEFVLEVVRDASTAGLQTSILTNGQFLMEEYANCLKSAGLDRVEISLYGATAKVHDWFTGLSGSYQRTLDGIKAARAAKLSIVVSTAITRRNLEDILLLPQVIHDYGVDGIQLSSLISSGRCHGSMDKYTLTEKEMAFAIRKIESAFDGMNYLFLNSLFPNPELSLKRYCHYFVEKLVIDHQGNVIPCCLLPAELKMVLGNIETDSLQNICSEENVREKPIFYWLSKGHALMKDALNYQKQGHNLCALCVDMLYLLTKQSSKTTLQPF